VCEMVSGTLTVYELLNCYLVKFEWRGACRVARWQVAADGGDSVGGTWLIGLRVLI